MATTETPAAPAPAAPSLSERVQRIIDSEEGQPALPIQAPEAEAPEPEAEGEPNAQAEGGEAAASEAQPETVEIEIKGKIYQIPAEIKDEYLAQSDYTRKIQEVAKQRETVQQREQAAQQAVAALSIAGPLIAEWHNTQQYLQQVAQIDLNALRQQAPDQANRLEIQALSARQKLNDLNAQLAQVPQVLREMDDKAVRDEATRNLPDALKLVPDLPKRTQEFAQAGAKYGFSPQELGRITDPRLIACLRDLADYQKLTANRESIKEKVAAAPPVAKPGARAAPAANATKEYNQALRTLRSSRGDDAFLNALRAQRKAQGT